MCAEVPLAGDAQSLKVLSRQHERSELDDGRNIEPVRGQTRPQVEERNLCLIREGRGDRAIGAHTDLSCNEHELGACWDDRGVRVRPDGGVNIAGIQEFHRHSVASEYDANAGVNRSAGRIVAADLLVALVSRVLNPCVELHTIGEIEGRA